MKIDLANKEFRFQVIPITVANGSPANGLTEANVTLDRDFNRIVGVAFFTVSDGGIPSDYNVGARTNRKQWIDDINVNAWNADSNVGPEDKYFQVSIPYGSGDTFYARVTLNGNAPSSDLVGQMVVMLVRDLTEQPK